MRELILSSRSSFTTIKKYFDFVDRRRKAGINAPIIPGIKPLSTKQHLSFLPHFFKVDLPDDLVKAVVECKDNKAARQVGIEWGIKQAQELKAAGVPAIHFYSMGRPDNIAAIARATF